MKSGLQQTRLFPGRFSDLDWDYVIRKLRAAGIDTRDMSHPEEDEALHLGPIAGHNDEDDKMATTDGYILKKGVRVEAQFRGKPSSLWFPGMILFCNSVDSEVDVMYDNGRVDFRLGSDFVRRPQTSFPLSDRGAARTRPRTAPPLGSGETRPNSARLSRQAVLLQMADRPKSADPAYSGHRSNYYYDSNDASNIKRQLFSANDTSPHSGKILSRSVPNKIHRGNFASGSHLTSSSIELASSTNSRALSTTNLTPPSNKTSDGDNLHRMGQLAEREAHPERAATLYREAYILKKRDYGAQHQSTVLSLSAYARALTEAKSYDKAREAHELVIRIKKEVYGDGHISTAMSFAELGIVYYRQGHNDQAILEFRRALRSGDLAGKAQHVIMSMPLVFLGNALIRSDPKWKQEVRAICFTLVL